MRPPTPRPLGWGALLGSLLIGLLVVPVLGLLLAASPSELASGLRHPLFAPALGLSLWTSTTSLVLIVVLGTPLAWWMASARGSAVKATTVLVQLPIVFPPAVIGVALLETFGRQGLLGPVLTEMGIGPPFTPAAVVLAQVVVASPFYVQAAANAFLKVDMESLLVARTLGASERGAWLTVALPTALPGLVAGASLAWARAIGEFGATLLFAGNLSGRTQTMPLVILTALESDIRLAVALSLALAAIGAGLLLLISGSPGAIARRIRGSA